MSHELRNPLNAIISKNIEKKHLYDELEKYLENNNSNPETFKESLKKLKRGNKIQENSATIMLFMVQDLLDSAQIK